MGMGGVQRTAKFVKYLTHFDWEVFVLTTNQKTYLAKDECLLQELESDKIQIFRTGTNSNDHSNDTVKVVRLSDDRLRQILSKLSQTFLIPDSKILWKKKALHLAEKIISENKIDIIFSTAPPYTDFLIALELKKKFSIPFVLDYRDSWIDCPNNYYPTQLHKNSHSKLETAVLKNTDMVITINSRIKELLIERYPFLNEEDAEIIPQGFDQQDFHDVKNKVSKNEKMKITYSGSFLNYYTPEYFLRALAALFEENPERRNHIEAVFIGLLNTEHEKMIDRLGLKDSIKLLGYKKHSECISHLNEADILWMMINKTDRSDLHSTGKLYEYFGARKPILACVPDGVAKDSLKEYGAAEVCEPDDIDSIKRAIEKFYTSFVNNQMPVPDEKVISKYERKHLTEKLSGIFDKVLQSHKENIKLETEQVR